jgi:hypothetical protein
MNVFSKFRKWREDRFRKRIDRVYFHEDGKGNRFIQGHLFAIKDEKTGQPGGLTACVEDIGLDKVQSIIEHTRLEFEKEKNSLSQLKLKQVPVS